MQRCETARLEGGGMTGTKAACGRGRGGMLASGNQQGTQLTTNVTAGHGWCEQHNNGMQSSDK